MGVNQVNNYGVGDNNFTSFQNTLDVTRRGGANVTISEYDTDAAPSVKVGSWFENNGALIEVVSADETPTGYSGITNDTEFYLYYDASAEAFIYSEDEPDWSDSKQGWYHPTETNDRALFSMFKDSGGTLYQDKTFIQQESFQRNVITDSIEEKNTGEGVKHLSKTKWKYYYEGNGETNGDIYDAISSWVPNVGDKMPVYGITEVQASSNSISVVTMQRTSTTEIYFTGLQFTGSSTLGALIVGSGSPAIMETFEIMSSYDAYN